MPGQPTVILGKEAIRLYNEAVRGDVAGTRALIDSGAEAATTEGFSALGWAAYTGGQQGLETLIVAGADIDRPDQWGYTPVMRAAMNHYPAAVRALAAAGASLDGVTAAGETIDDLLVSTGDRSMAALLAEIRAARAAHVALMSRQQGLRRAAPKIRLGGRS